MSYTRRSATRVGAETAVFLTMLHGGENRQQVVGLFVDSLEYFVDLARADFPKVLHRLPSLAEMNLWAQYGQNGGDETALIATLIGSDEYFARL